MRENDEWIEVVSNYTKNTNRRRERNINHLEKKLTEKGLNYEVAFLPLNVCNDETLKSNIIGQVIGRQGINVKKIIAETNVDSINFNEKINGFIISTKSDNINFLINAKDILTGIIDTHVTTKNNKEV